MITNNSISGLPKYILKISLLIMLIISACRGNNDEADAYGNFQSVEVTVSSQVQGELLLLDIREGQNYEKGELAESR